MGIDEVKAVLRTGIDAGRDATDAMRSVQHEVASIYTTTVTTTHDSAHHAVVMAASRLHEAAHEVGLVLRRLQASREAANRYLGAIG